MRETLTGKYEEVREFIEGTAAVRLNGKWGFVNKSGDEFIPCKYEEVRDFSMDDGECRSIEITAVRLNGRWGFVNWEGTEIIPCKYEEANDFRHFSYTYNKTTDGEWPDFDNLIEINEEVYAAAVRLNGKWGFINQEGIEFVPCKYDRAWDFVRHQYELHAECIFDFAYAYVELNGKCGFIDKNGNEFVPCEYDDIYDFEEARAIVRKNGKWGFVNWKGAEIVPCKYEEVQDFAAGKAAVRLNGKWGLINRYGEEILPCTYASSEAAKQKWPEMNHSKHEPKDDVE